MNDCGHNLQVIFKSLERVIVIMRVFCKDEIIDGKLRQAVLLLAGLSGKCIEKFPTKSSNAFGNIVIEEFRVRRMSVDLLDILL